MPLNYISLLLRDTKYYQDCLKNQSLDFGEFYFFEKFVVGEIREETILDFTKAEYLLDIVEEYYNKNIPNYYISNKIFSYSVDPSLWAKLSPRLSDLHYLIIEKTASAKINTMFEKMFFEGQLQKFKSLDLAIQWVMLQVGSKISPGLDKDKFHNS